MFTLLMSFFDFDATKVKYRYCQCKVSFHSTTTLNCLSLAINNVNLQIMFPRGQNYAKILLSRKMPKSLQNMTSKNFHVASDYSILKNKFARTNVKFKTNKHKLYKIKSQIKGICYKCNL